MFAALTLLKTFAGGFLKIDFKTILKWLAVIALGFILYKAYAGVRDYMQDADAAKAKVTEQHEQLVKFKEDTDVLIQTNKDNAEKIKKLEESNKISLAAVEKSNADKQANNEKLVVVKKTTTAKIATIQKKYQDVPKTPEVIKAESTEISTVQIDSLWTTYCDGNDDPLCKASS